jgi:hypothetical protein
MSHIKNKIQPTQSALERAFFKWDLDGTPEAIAHRRLGDLREIYGDNLLWTRLIGLPKPTWLLDSPRYMPRIAGPDMLCNPKFKGHVKLEHHIENLFHATRQDLATNFLIALSFDIRGSQSQINALINRLSKSRKVG